MSKCPDDRRGTCFENRFRVERRGETGPKKCQNPIKHPDSLFRDHDFFNARTADPDFQRFGRNFRLGLVGLLSSLLIGGHVYQLRLRERWDQGGRGVRLDGPGGDGDEGGLGGSNQEQEVKDAVGDAVSETKGTTVADQEHRTSKEGPIATDQVENVLWKVMRGKATHMVAMVDKEPSTRDPNQDGPCGDERFEESPEGSDTISDDVFLKYAGPKPKRGDRETIRRSHTSSWN